MNDDEIQALFEENGNMYLDMDSELGDYEWLDDTGHWDRRLYTSRIRVSDILYALSSDKDFHNLEYWEVQKPEAQDAVQYYWDNREVFEYMDDDIYDVESLDEGAEFWEQNKENYEYEKEFPSDYRDG